jgi:hypothetical protein
MATSPRTVQLRTAETLRDFYLTKINYLVAEGREDLIDPLTREYAEECARLAEDVSPSCCPA